MGNTLSCTGGKEAIYEHRQEDKKLDKKTTITKKRKKKSDQSVQTECITKEMDTQTALTFVEKLTHNNIQEVGSSEMFDVNCEVCIVGSEKNAVGFCRTCRQYMCLQCCKIHEALSSSKNHAMVGKVDFKQVMKLKSLYDQNLVPIHHCSLEYDGFSIDMRKIGAFNIPNCDDIYFWTPHGNVCTLTTIDQQSGYPSSKIIKVSHETTDDLCELSDPKCKKRVYFVISKDIYSDSVSSDLRSVVYKYCLKHDGDNVRIAFQFKGNCHSVVPFNNHLALSAYIQTGFTTPDWQVRFVDFKGAIINQICYNGHGKPLFKEPRHLASSHTEDILFVSDYGLKSVIALDKHGQTLFTFSLHELKVHPMGITCDEENNVYVACKNMVIQIKRGGLKGRIILEPYMEKDRYYSSKRNEIVNICYNPITKKLAVTDNSEPTATIFMFLP